MVDSVKTESFRTEQLKNQLEARQDRELKEIKEKHKNELEKTIEGHNVAKRDLEGAYSVQLSNIKDEQEKKLGDIRSQNNKVLDSEKQNGDDEVEKTRNRYQEQIARYRENAEKQMEDIRSKNEANRQAMVRARERGKA